MTRGKAGVLLAVLAALAALILLSASLAEVDLQPGQPMPAVAHATPGAELPASFDLPGGLSAQLFMRIVYVLMMVLLPVSIIVLLVSRELRKQVLARLIPLVLILAVLVLGRSRLQDQRAAATPVPAEVEPGASAEEGSVIAFDASPPTPVVWVTRIVVGLALALVAGIALWLLWRASRRERRPIEQVAEQAMHAIEALQAGDDVRNVILRCYFEMSCILADERGLKRQSTMTPREFERRLTEAGLPELAVQRLTRLFEGVRYGAKIAAGAEEEQAIASLAAIVDACRSAA
jgi:hypothetical protein